MAEPSLAPVLLVSMPQMLDPNFSKTVVLLAEYGPSGAFGLVINRRMDEPAHLVVTADEPLEIHPEMYLFTGGPVDPTRAWILTADATMDPEALELIGGVYLSASPSVVRRTLQAEPDTGTRMVVGYAGWGAGQLELEMQANGWLNCPADAELIFNMSADIRYEMALRRIGIDPAMLSMEAGHA